MRKITLFLLIAVCAIVLLTTEPCEGKKKTDVAAGEGIEESAGDKSMGQGRQNRDRRPGHDDEHPGQAGERGNGKGRGRRNPQNGKDNKKNKPRDGSSEENSKEKREDNS